MISLKNRHLLTLVVALVALTVFTGLGAAQEERKPLPGLPKQRENDTLVAREYTLAELHYKNGLRIIFSYDDISKDYGLSQDGRIGESTPLAQDQLDTLLDAYLAFTPANLPVPEELLWESSERKGLKTDI